jgi:predicted lactoylglutathione lyase
MSVPARLSLVTLGAVDLPRLRAFYGALGWSENAGGTDQYASFDTGGARLALFPLDALYADAHVDEPSSSPRPFGVTMAINCSQKSDVDDAMDVVRVAGGTVTKDPEDAFWGGYSACFTDPEGNLWEIAWSADFRFDDRGALLP